DHPWRGVARIEPLLPTDMKELLSDVTEAIGSLTEVAEAFMLLSSAFHGARTVSPSLKDVQQLAQFALRIVKAPAMDCGAIGNPAWEHRREEIIGLVERGRSNAESLAGLQGTVEEVAWQTDLSVTRRSLATHGRSLFRWFRKDYRESVALLR